ncbi:nicotinate phosphoribosyltransferase [Catenibacillus scindens]|uniref:Nicotinate phosphoribosyltransferase n=1 Tax=Catenibacillus scindens TaxID=673271 RepID=A0A7W8M407_9FIRM|nr:nicotinate phosphoribosyltransferase [Catenibacillus scindens]MBB5263349.1 nicotinate phosphoribosyltransferase [Catenibacillus scindens]
MSRYNLTLLTDLYELTMMQGYYENNTNETVVFDVFYRNNPSGGAYAIAAGLDQIIDYIKNLRFEAEDIEYLRSTGIFQESFLAYLADFSFSGDIYAIPEGTVVFPKEPLLKVIAPIMEAQLVETAILNIINHQSLIATKASRVVYAAGGGVMEFGLRRAQGPDAGTYGARAAVIAGCVGTSNVLAGKLFNIPIKGTHAHSWIMSFKTELEAFRNYARLYPDNCLLLVDTYDTLKSGVPHAIQVFTEMKEAGLPKPSVYGIRLDSGDLAYLSKKARKMLDAAGFTDAVISASSDLDEYLIESLRSQGAQITSWGVGTNLITSKDCPAFGGVYKLAAVQGPDGKFIPKIKVSENIEKVTDPGNKTIFRIYDKETGKIRGDLIALADETYDSQQSLIIFDPIATWKRTYLEGGSYTIRELLVPIFMGGQCVYTSPCVMDIQTYCQKELNTLWDESRRLANPQTVYVDLSRPLWELKNQLLDNIHNFKDKK